MIIIIIKCKIFFLLFIPIQNTRTAHIHFCYQFSRLAALNPKFPNTMYISINTNVHFVSVCTYIYIYGADIAELFFNTRVKKKNEIHWKWIFCSVRSYGLLYESSALAKECTCSSSATCMGPREIVLYHYCYYSFVLLCI